MKRKNLLIISALSLSVAATACSTTTAPAETNPNTNVAVAQNNANPIANVPPSTPVTNSAVAGIPNAPTNFNMAVKGDPTKNAKVENMASPAPDNSEITISLGQYPVETRTFRKHAQLAKVERIQDVANKRTIVKVYLRSGQVKELPENAVQNPMAAPAAEILEAAQNAQPAKPEPKMENPPLPAPNSEQRLEKRLPTQRNQ
ncbi:MAG: hypothetical protein M3209_02465 [Acidobacteriota bacterium]|nr:hypothetical protein [Acidobacteriota bacterium]